MFQTETMNGLRRITRALATLEDLDETLDLIVHQTSDLMRADSCSLYLLDPDGETLRLRATTGLDQGALGLGTLKIGEGMTGQAVLQNRPVFAAHAKANQYFKRVKGAKEMGFESLLAVPLIVEEKVIGALNVQTIVPHDYSENEVSLLALIADLAAGTLYKTGLAERQKGQLEELKALAHLSEVVTAPQYLEDMLDVVTGMAAQTMNAAVCSIFLLDESRQFLELRSAKRNDSPYQYRPPLPMGLGAIGRVAHTGEPITIENVQKDKRYLAQELARREGLVSLLAVPLTVRERVIGVMTCYTRERVKFTRQQKALFGTLANQTALAIENAQLITNAAVVKEMHHRIKNNLQTVAMLMRLQMSDAERMNTREVLEVSIGRVQSIAAVHEVLSERGFRLVDVKDVIQRITRAIMIAPHKEIAIQIQGEEMSLTSRRATALALVINELVQNAVEHAFVDQTAGTITVTLAHAPAAYLVTVADNGRGLPAELERHLGLELIENLVVGDLKGEIKMQNLAPGAEFMVSFPRQPVEPEEIDA